MKVLFFGFADKISEPIEPVFIVNSKHLPALPCVEVYIE